MPPKMRFYDDAESEMRGMREPDIRDEHRKTMENFVVPTLRKWAAQQFPEPNTLLSKFVHQNWDEYIDVYVSAGLEEQMAHLGVCAASVDWQKTTMTVPVAQQVFIGSTLRWRNWADAVRVTEQRYRLGSSGDGRRVGEPCLQCGLKLQGTDAPWCPTCDGPPHWKGLTAFCRVSRVLENGEPR